MATRKRNGASEVCCLAQSLERGPGLSREFGQRSDYESAGDNAELNYFEQNT